MRTFLWLAVPLALLAEPAPLDPDAERVVGCADSPSERLLPTQGIPPGAPPAFAFRVFDASDRGRLADVGLMTDDAGH